MENEIQTRKGLVSEFLSFVFQQKTLAGAQGVGARSTEVTLSSEVAIVLSRAAGPRAKDCHRESEERLQANPIDPRTPSKPEIR